MHVHPSKNRYWLVCACTFASSSPACQAAAVAGGHRRHGPESGLESLAYVPAIARSGKLSRTVRCSKRRHAHVNKHQPAPPPLHVVASLVWCPRRCPEGLLVSARNGEVPCSSQSRSALPTASCFRRRGGACALATRKDRRDPLTPSAPPRKTVHGWSPTSLGFGIPMATLGWLNVFYYYSQSQLPPSLVLMDCNGHQTCDT